MTTLNARRMLFLANIDRFFWSHRLPLARAVQDAGIEVIVASPPGRYRAAIEAAGIEFHPIRFQRESLNPLAEVLALRDIIGVYRRFRPDLVHHITFKSIVLGSLAARLVGVRAVVNAITGLGYVFTGQGLKRAVLRRVAEAGYSWALSGRRMRVIFQNHDDRDLFVGKRLVPADRTTVISGSGVDAQRFAPTPEPEGPVTVLLASRMLWDKGVGDLVQASRLLGQQGIPCRILLAGEPDPANPAAVAATQLAQWQAEGLVTWLGHQEDMPALVAGCHIACLPSYREGLPLSLIEAAASARPIVTTDVPGCRDVVRDGVNGLLVPPRDPARLAAALRRLIEAPQLRQEMGRRGREMALERFTLQHVIDQTLSVYDELLGERAG
jgi:glycosyltransferase involved in cell wall biosynthesis